MNHPAEPLPLAAEGAAAEGRAGAARLPADTGPASATPTATAPAAGVVGHALPHESAALHVTGAAPYTDDVPEPAGTLHAALGLSPLAHGVLLGIDVARLRALPGVVDVLTAAEIPGRNDCGPLVADDPILASADDHDDEVRALGADSAERACGARARLKWHGQPVFAVVATTRAAARAAAALAPQVIQADALPPRLDPREAAAAGELVVPPLRLARGDADGAIAQAPQRADCTVEIGGQEHFYLEGQVALAVPQEGGAMDLLCSTQHPSEMQHLVAHALGLPAHAVRVACRRMGGGFGGKESQSALVACVAAVAAARLQRPVKLRLDRDDDFRVTGGRHAFSAEIEAGHDEAGRIVGVRARLVSQAGHSADLSAPVMTRALCHFDNAYWLPHVALQGLAARTHTRSNTAFRGFGGPQGAFAVEYLLDTVARRLGRDALDVRLANLYGVGERDLTPYGQRVHDNILLPLISELERTSDYRARRAAITAFNAASPVLQRGLALTPVKFGISFNVVHLNQAGALVLVYTDGSVLVNHGGTEMGQGLNTKVAQVVAQAFGLPLSAVRCSATDTAKVPNTSATAASTGSDLNGMAALQAALTVRQRLAQWLAAQWGCAAEAIDFADGALHGPAGQRLRFADAARQANLARVQLWSDGFYATPGLRWDKATLQGEPFYYFAYGAAVSEVLLDTLTGEHRLLRVDVLHDVGASLNPALDIGQIEGGFVQGLGWLTMEELVWHPADGSARAGALATHAPSTYKIPTAGDLPADFRVALFRGAYGAHANAMPTVHRSKAVGEPPLLLAFSAFFAIRDAIAAAAGPGCVPSLRAPATPEAVLAALDTARAAASS